MVKGRFSYLCRLFNVLVVVTILGFASPTAEAGTYGGGSGTAGDPYRIATAEDLNSISLDPNDWDKHFKMTADINMAGYTYTTALIAPDTDNTNWYFDGTPFTGTFNGSNHTIHNLTIDTAGANNGYLGLFGQLRSSTVVSNLRLENANITGGTYYVGGLCGSNGDYDLGYPGGIISDCYFNGSVTCGNSSYAVGGLVGFSEYGTISNCYTTGYVSGGDYIGGLVGHNNYGTIFNCYNSNGYVSGGENSYAVGGLVGYNEYGTISNCHSNGYVTGGYNSYAVGGLVGEHYEGSISNCYVTGSVDADDTIGSLVGRIYYGSVSNCYSAGTVTGESYTIGGLVGQNDDGSISHCYVKGTIRGSKYEIGGLTGYNEGVISDCHTEGTILGKSSVAGLVGQNDGPIVNCSSKATVQGEYQVAGLVGINHVWGTITNCYASGNIKGYFSTGGLVGDNSAADSLITNCYATGDVTGGRESTGGLVGRNYALIYNSYATGRVTGDFWVGGLVGSEYSPTYIGCFWNTDVNPDVNGIGNGSDSNVIGETTANMQMAGTFIDAGWDFNTPIWIIDEGVDYPRLWWEMLIEPVDLAAELSDDVSAMSLPKGITNSLQVKLDTALRLLDDENEHNDVAAINSLQAFTNVVNAQRGKKISEEDADYLVTAAQQIIDMLSSE